LSLTRRHYELSTDILSRTESVWCCPHVDVAVAVYVAFSFGRIVLDRLEIRTYSTM